MSRFKLLYFVIFIINLIRVNAQISDKRLCVDEECKVPISLARTLLKYSSPDSRILSFAPNAEITIYSKSAGSREDLWGGEINGKRGYVPKHLVRETKILQKPTVLVDTEFSNETTQVPSQLEPDKVQEPYEVVDGTTIFSNPQDNNISPSSTQSPIQATALPQTEADTEEASQNQESEDDDEEDEEPDDEDDDIEVEFEALEDAAEDSQNSKSKEAETVTETPPPKVEEPVIKDKEETPLDSSNVNNISETSEKKEDSNGEEEAKIEVTTFTPEIEVPQPFEDIIEEVTPNPLESETEIGKMVENLIPTLPSLGFFSNFNANEPNQADNSNSIETENVATSSQIPDLAVISDPQEAENVSNSNLQDQAEIAGSKEAESPEIVGSKEAKIAVPEGAEIIGAKEADIAISEGAEIVVSKEADIAGAKEAEVAVSEGAEIIGAKEAAIAVSEGAEIVASKEADIAGAKEAEVADSKEAETGATSDQQNKEEISADQQNLDIFESKEAVQQNQETVGTKEAISDQQTQEIDGSNEAISDQQDDAFLAQQNQEIAASDQEFADSKEAENVTIPDQEEISDSKEAIPDQQIQEEVSVSNEVENVVPVDSEEASVNQQNQEISDSKEAVPDQPIFVSEEAENAEEMQKEEEISVSKEEEGGFFSGLLSIFGSSANEKEAETVEELTVHETVEELAGHVAEQSCDAPSQNMDFFTFNSDVFIYLVTTAVSVIIFLFGYIAFDKSKREGPLVAKINNLEKELLIIVKENQILQEKISTDSGYDTNSHEAVENLKQDLYELTSTKNMLEEQVQSLEKELENSTEVGMELNRMLSEILSSEGGSDVIRANVEHLQRQLVEQQATINSVNETLAITNTENHELKLELELSNKKVVELQAELDKMLLNVLKIEEEKDTQQTSLETEVTTYKQKYEDALNEAKIKDEEIKQMKNRSEQAERKLQLKIRENEVLADSLKAVKTNDSAVLQSLLDSSEIKAELQLVKSENAKFAEMLQRESEAKSHYEKQALAAVAEAQLAIRKYDEADKSKLETETKLEVLANYFKEKEAQLQKEIAKHESLWVEKQGEATSTTERVKFMQEQLQNYKAQTESLKQEIMSQEVELKSQISVLEKKAHENWVSARQAERKLEEAKQEAAQLRHRLTLRERALQEDKNQHRYQSPIEQNGDIPESPASPPLLYGTREHITKSPPIPGLPPFLPPPPGVPFMPPPLPGVPPFIPPPPNMFPGDHRPPPLGRMSSPPLNSRYSPSSRGYSPYDSSQSDSEYGTSPPQRRGYSPFNSRGEERRDYKRAPPGRSNGRNILKDGGSSGSGHSHESLDKINRQQSKV